MRLSRKACLVATVLASIACAEKPAADRKAASASPAAGVSISGRDWVLISLGDRIGPVGAGNQPLTLRFDGATSQASGFGGCNRFTASFTSVGDSLLMGPIASTKMACAGVDDLERSYFNTLRSITSYSVSEPVLTLNAAPGPVARFRGR